MVMFFLHTFSSLQIKHLIVPSPHKNLFQKRVGEDTEKICFYYNAKSSLILILCILSIFSRLSLVLIMH